MLKKRFNVGSLIVLALVPATWLLNLPAKLIGRVETVRYDMADGELNCRGGDCLTAGGEVLNCAGMDCLAREDQTSLS